MQGIATSISIVDRMTAPIVDITNALNNMANRFDIVEEATDINVPFDNVTEQVNNAVEALQNQINSVKPKNIPVTVDIDNNAFDTMTSQVNNAVEALQNQIGGIKLEKLPITIDFDTNVFNDILDELGASQKRITEQALKMKLISPNTIMAVQSAKHRVEELTTALDQIKTIENPINYNDMQDDLANTVNLQHKLNKDIEDGNVGNLQSGFKELNNIMGQVEQNIQQNMRLVEALNYEWESPKSIQLFTNTGIERFQSEMQSANVMVDRLRNSQSNIANQASASRILAPNAVADITNLNSRVLRLTTLLKNIENDQLDDIGADKASDQVEKLRQQLSQAIEAQEQLNRAMDNMDASGANTAYIRLNSIIDEATRGVRGTANEQQNFNNKINQSKNSMDGLVGKIGAAVAAYASIQSVKVVLGLSDEITQITARLALMNRGTETTIQLQDKIFQAAQRSRGEYMAMADSVSKMGTMAKDAFSGNDELIAFVEQVNKQFVIAGTNTENAKATMLQLTQAMGSGVLRGDELNSVLEQAPTIAQSIAEYMGVSIGKIRELASEGQVTAEVVKNAMLSAVDETDAKLAAMPQTFGQIWVSIKNNAIAAFQPILQRLNDIANSPAFQTLIANVTNSMTTVAAVVIEIFNIVMQVGQTLYTIWGKIAPAVIIAVSALNGYKIAMIAITTIETAVTAAKYAYIFALSIFSKTTALATIAQWGLNTALLANPIGLVIAAIMIIIVAFVLWTDKVVGITAALGALIVNAGIWFGNLGAVIWEFFVKVGEWFMNLLAETWVGIQKAGVWFANLGASIWNVLKACAANVLAAFSNAWINIQIGFNSLVSTIMTGIKKVIEWLNLMPNVSIDTTGISDNIDGLAERKRELEKSKKEYQDIGAVWEAGKGTYTYEHINEADTKPVNWNEVGDAWNTFKYNDVGDAYDAGAEAGTGLHDKMLGWIPGLGKDSGQNDTTTTSQFTGTNAYEPPPPYEPQALSGISGGVSNIDQNTKDSLEYSEEELKLWRDIAERDTINRFTTAEVQIDLGGVTNNVSSEIDLDGIVSYIADGLEEALLTTAERVHA